MNSQQALMLLPIISILFCAFLRNQKLRANMDTKDEEQQQLLDHRWKDDEAAMSGNVWVNWKFLRSVLFTIHFLGITAVFISTVAVSIREYDPVTNLSSDWGYNYNIVCWVWCFQSLFHLALSESLPVLPIPGKELKHFVV